MNAFRALIASLAAGLCLATPARAQAAETTGTPVYFTADAISYDKADNIVTASGHVRALQDGQTLYADKIVLNRATNVATASGHVILVQPGGDTVFADHAVLSQGMKNAIMRGVSARLAQNARLIANGGRRYNDQIDELTKIVYSACDLCKSDPTAPPLWQIRARSATRDLQHKTIEFRDADLEFDGFPIFYLPYLSEPDPSVRRQTGFLIPSVGSSSRLGLFTIIPYYIVINQESDITLTPILATKQGPALRANYRRAFNNGEVNIDASAGLDRGHSGNSIFSNGVFDLNPTWRAGFSYNHASNPTYLNDFSILPNAAYLASNVYVEGFAPGAYARLDAQTYQGLVTSVNQTELPIVAPHGQYHFISGQDSLGGRFHLDADFFNVERGQGTQSRRISAQPGYAVPLALPFGVVGTARVRLIAAGYSASHLNSQPNYSGINTAETARAVPFGAVFLRLPFIRSGAYGSQIIEPEIQIVTAPDIGIRQNARIPNEDSLDLEFSDANLFSLNRYPGIDRIAGGSRVDYALHSAWYLPGGAYVDGLIGQSYRLHKDHDYLPGSGLSDNVSDIVGRLTLAPTPLFNIVYRTRLSHADLGARMIDATANLGTHAFSASGGYLYSNVDPYVLYNLPSTTNVNLNPPGAYFAHRKEFTASIASNFGPWSLGAGTERNLETGHFDTANFNAGWQNNCFGVSLIYFERFTSFNLDKGSTTVLIQFNFKTLGNVGFSAL
ncbi:MAG: LPS assembly protein LptD [Acidocella sp.]|nr:LPS assembly protein LptD [Acidocella sp.]